MPTVCLFLVENYVSIRVLAGFYLTFRQVGVGLLLLLLTGY